MIGGRLEEALHPVSECALHVHGEIGICSCEPELNALRKYIKSIDPTVKKLSSAQVVDFLKKHLGVERESEIFENKSIQRFLGRNNTDKILKARFKTKGPHDSTALLDNFNIDEKLAQWARYAKKLYNKKFYHVSFQMIDFEKVQSELADLSLEDLIDEGFDCFGVVLNTDVSTGGGKHWFCLYGDFTKTPHTLEYFNSSGNPPRLEVSVWMEKAVHELFRDAKIRCKIINAMNGHKIQHSKTECGMWSLMYIKSRLDDKPPDYFIKAKATDDDMIKLRTHFFRPQ